jgi:glyoxylate reductase
MAGGLPHNRRPMARVRVRPGPPLAVERLKAAGLEPEVGGLDLEGVEGLLCLLTDRIDARLLEGADRLRIVANMAAGTDNVDLAAAERLGIAVTNTPDVLSEATADLAFALLLAVARRLVEGDRWVRSGRFTGWSPDLLLGLDVSGRTLGIVGAGRIGRAMARRAEGFGMRVLARGSREGTPLAELLERSDFVSLHVPLRADTHHLIGEPELRRMQSHALLINTARGPVVDEAALVRALREGWIAGAGLDVYEREPALAPGLAELENVVLAPHVGSATHGTRARMAEIAADNIVACLSGGPLPSAVVAGRR